jgi:hypothetical protein
MSFITRSGEPLESWILREVEFTGDLHDGSDSRAVRRLQEWLNLHNRRVKIDGDYGTVTQEAVRRFQNAMGLDSSGVVDEETHLRLVRPMLDVLKPLDDVFVRTLSGATADYARTHLSVHPREVGGPNMGPWVRLYMEGKEGEPFAWCAGFVSFVMKQSAETLGCETPIEGSFSCDELASQGKTAGLFLDESARASGSISDLPTASIFLIRKSADDWIHTGLVSRFLGGHCDTIEGNTNDEGHREGYEVAARSRKYSDKIDYVILDA